jgi:ATP-dependent Lon protease
VTANVLDSIPEPLKDRMDILRLSGYIMEEKVKIAQEFLIPRNRKAMGLKVQDVEFSISSLKHMINGYAREAGVRTFENSIKKTLRKVAVQVVKAEESKVKKKRLEHRITEKNLEKYLGKPIFTSDCFYPTTPAGVCMGLAWTSMGGATLYVEAIDFPSEKTEMKLTGQAGDVMKESSQIAWSYLQSAYQEYAPGRSLFDKKQIHIHIPEGATPKDGPSAGVTMLTSLISLLRNQPVLQNLGMTGELTLTGKVLPIGGVKEKLIAARRSGVKTLIFPKENKRDFDELPAYIKKGLEVHFVDHYDEVFRVAFPSKR